VLLARASRRRVPIAGALRDALLDLAPPLFGDDDVQVAAVVLGPQH
jgi:hypothetical protein